MHEGAVIIQVFFCIIMFHGTLCLKGKEKFASCSHVMNKHKNNPPSSSQTVTRPHTDKSARTPHSRFLSLNLLISVFSTLVSMF